eukprot:SAG31_NODE_42_length_31262_cov_46.416231_30_plen_55_part_00
MAGHKFGWYEAAKLLCGTKWKNVLVDNCSTTVRLVHLILVIVAVAFKFHWKVFS